MGASALTALAGASFLATLAPGDASAQGAVPSCTPQTNVEAIIDDSGSMAFRDFHQLRRAGLELFTRLAGNERTTLGAVEFGGSADTLFAPQPIATGRRAMVAALRARINADRGGTDYNSGFVKASQDNPSAMARIFLTDGANDGPYAGAHLGGPRTYVVGLRQGAPRPADPVASRLQQIASDTGGVYFPVVDPALVQPTFNAISTAALCLAPPSSFPTRILSRAGQTSVRATPIATSTRKLDLVLSWAQPNNSLTFASVQLLGRGNRVIADLTGVGRPRRLRATRATGATFQTLTVGKPAGARRIRFRVAAIRVFRREAAIAQLTQRIR